MPLTTEEARAVAEARWRNDTKAVATLVDRVVRRAPVLTPAQRDRIRAALDSAETE
jgi:hypothetical protein